MGPFLALERLFAKLERTARRRVGLEKTVYVESRVSEYREFWAGAARLMGAEFRDLGPALWEVEKNGRHTRIHNADVELNDVVVAALCSDKVYAYSVAERLGVPVPRHAVYDLKRLGEAKRRLREEPGAYVVKPARNSSSGIGVSTHVCTARELERAAVLASLFHEEFILERMVAGEACRLLYLKGRFLHGVRRRGVRVTGDGRSTLDELAARAGLTARSRDRNAHWTLESQGLDWAHALAAGREVLVRSLPLDETKRRELRTVYTEDITSMVGAGLLEEAGRVVAALEANLAGVDVVTIDPRVSLRESGGALLEVNPGPGIHHHYITEEDGREHRVAKAILKALLEE
jgi:cyanophycin synthetase